MDWHQVAELGSGMLKFLATELVNAEARIKDLETRHAEDGAQIKTLETQLARQACKLRSYTDKERRVFARVFEMFTEAKKVSDSSVLASPQGLFMRGTGTGVQGEIFRRFLRPDAIRRWKY
jgi:uncharacterized coiled-coil protein SlyX